MLGTTRRMLRGAIAMAVVLVAVAGYAQLTWATFELGDATSGPVMTTVTAPDGMHDRRALLARLGDAGVTTVVIERPEEPAATELVAALGADGAIRPFAATTAEVDAAAVERLAGAGYAGIHVRLGAFAAGSPDVLDRLEQLHATARDLELTLSVTVPPVEPLPGLATGTGLLLGSHAPVHAARSHRRLAHRVDQLVVDLGVARLPTVSLSGSLARRLITATGEALAGIDVAMIVQVPRLGDVTESIRAVRQAAARGRGWPRHVGVAVPPSWLDDPDARASFRDAWAPARG